MRIALVEVPPGPPVIATITAEGFVRVPEAEVAERFRGLIDELTAREAAGRGRVPETSDLPPLEG